MKRILSVICISIFLLLASGSEFAEVFFTSVMDCDSLEETNVSVETVVLITAIDESGIEVTENIEIHYKVVVMDINQELIEENVYCIPQAREIISGNLDFNEQEDFFNIPTTTFKYSTESLIIQLSLSGYYGEFIMMPNFNTLKAYEIGGLNTTLLYPITVQLLKTR